MDSGEVHIFREPDRDPSSFQEFFRKVSVWIGHNFLGFDYIHINRLVPGVTIDPSSVIDTLVVSKLTHYDREGGHSLSRYGVEFGIPKIDFSSWDSLSPEMIDYCVRDIEINYRLYLSQLPFITSPLWKKALRTEHDMVLVCNEIHDNGFYFNTELAESLFAELTDKVEKLHLSLIEAFPPRTKFLREICPRGTRHGTINRSDFRFLLRDGDGDLSHYSIGAPFSRFEYVPFNPGSPVQVVQRLNEAGWQPTEKTKGHFLAEKEYQRNKSKENLDRLESFRQTGWSICETNLQTLPPGAPDAAKSLAHYLLLNSRKRLLETQLLPSVQEDGRIHPKINAIGTWTHRTSCAEPNLANIPTEKPQDTDEIKEINNILRSLFCVPEDRLLIGVDADSIQLRVLAHYMDDPRFTEALVRGDKSKGTDVHSLNVSAIGPACRGRRDAKTFIYAWLLGAGVARVAEILGCDREAARDARERFIEYYPGLRRLRDEIIAQDAKRGYFQGFDGRFVICKGEDEDQRRHYMLGGYLQNGESIIMDLACLRWREKLKKERIPFWQVNYVYDEWQTETINDLQVARYIADVQADSIRLAGEELGLRCPMAGSILGAHESLAIGRTWLDTH